MENILDYCTISGESVKKYEGTKKYVATGDVIENKIINFSEVDYMNKPSRANQIAKEGDVIFAKMKDTKKVMKIDKENSEYIYSTGFYIIKPNEGILTDYMYWVFNSNKFNRDKDKQCKGATQKALNNEGLKKIKINKIPDIVEQQRIVSKLNKIDKILNKKKKQLIMLDELIKSQFVEMFGETSEAYKKHRIIKLSEIAEYYNGLTYKPVDVSEMGTIVLRSGNIQNSKLEYSDIVRVKSNIKEKQYVKENDILMCSRNGSEKLVGKVAMIKEQEEKMTFGAFMLIIRSKYYTYLFSYFQSDDFRKKIKYGATTTINQITVNMLNKLELPMPDIKLQNQFSEIVKQIDKQKFEIEKSLKETQELYESLMEKYFG